MNTVFADFRHIMCIYTTYLNNVIVPTCFSPLVLSLIPRYFGSGLYNQYNNTCSSRILSCTHLVEQYTIAPWLPKCLQGAPHQLVHGGRVKNVIECFSPYLGSNLENF